MLVNQMFSKARSHFGKFFGRVLLRTKKSSDVSLAFLLASANSNTSAQMSLASAKEPHHPMDL
jgi:hypothetical protein